MAKKHLYFSEAEHLYVVEQMTIAEIASRLGVSEKTIRLWKQEGDWDHKRQQYLQSKKAFHEELYEFARKLMQTIRQDMDAGQKVDPGRLYAFTRILPLITKVKDYEEVMKEKDKKQTKGLSEEALQIIEKEILGL